jgi:hypothetical protein
MYGIFNESMDRAVANCYLWSYKVRTEPRNYKNETAPFFLNTM